MELKDKEVVHKDYCSRCNHSKDEVGGLMKHSKRETKEKVHQYYYCRKCNRKRVNDYYHNGGKDNVRQAIKSYEEDNPEKRQAWSKLNTAIATNKVDKPSVCGECGEKTPSRQLQGHHHDYDKPLDVEWLCMSCHADRHE